MNIYIWSFVSLVEYKDRFYYITALFWDSSYGREGVELTASRLEKMLCSV